MSQNAIGSDGVTALVEHFFPRTLRDLDLSENEGLTERAVLAFARCERLTELLRLHIGFAGFASDGPLAKALRESPHILNMTGLWIGRTAH